MTRLSAAFTLSFIILATSCKAERGSPYLCSCVFVTDFDQDLKRNVEICATDPSSAIVAGQNCAQSGSPGPVQSCTCNPKQPPQHCELDVCQMIER